GGLGVFYLWRRGGGAARAGPGRRRAPASAGPAGSTGPAGNADLIRSTDLTRSAETAKGGGTTRSAGGAASAADGARPGRREAAGAAATGGDPAGRDDEDPVTRTTGTIVVDVRRLAGSGSRVVEIALDTRRRGVISFGPVLVRRADPFGLVSSVTRLASADALRVRPRARPLGAPPAAPARDPDGRTADGAAGGVIFHGLREYVSGEDLRFVHWPSSARTGRLMVREHVEPSEPASTLVLDTRPDAYPPGEVGADTFEEAVDAAASIALGCARESLGVVLLTTDGVRRAGRGRAPETDALLDDLAEVVLDPAGTLEVLGTVRRGGIGTLVVVTGGFDAGQLRAVAPVVHRFGQVVVVRVGARSMAAARARSRRTRADRPRLRPASASPDAATLLGRFDLIGRPSEIGSSVAGRLRVLDVPDAARLREAWPTSGRGRAAGVRSNARTGYFGGGAA
ncbi:DUF58 domain-containing protein, partial [Frankia nepalensis]|uniref:DUF58 domain-containing protein n=1 Tax=Frankia nepalensis TaxID=1836974 RepID=UPI002551DCEA